MSSFDRVNWATIPLKGHCHYRYIDCTNDSNHVIIGFPKHCRPMFDSSIYTLFLGYGDHSLSDEYIFWVFVSFAGVDPYTPSRVPPVRHWSISWSSSSLLSTWHEIVPSGQNTCGLPWPNRSPHNRTYDEYNYIATWDVPRVRDTARVIPRAIFWRFGSSSAMAVLWIYSHNPQIIFLAWQSMELVLDCNPFDNAK